MKREFFENSPRYREDKSDGKFFPYEFYPGKSLGQGGLFASDSYQILLVPRNVPHKDLDEKEDVKTRTKNKGDIDIIEHKEDEINEFRRDEFFWINHLEEDHPILKVVIEQRSHRYDGQMLSPHFNWKGESEEEIKCEKCQSYFGFINHIEIVFQESSEEKNYKLIDWKGTLKRFCDEVKNSDWYQENQIEELVDTTQL